MLDRNNDREKFQRLAFRTNLLNARKILEIFEKNKIDPVLIKGFAAAVNYPQPFQRVFSDIDLAVEPARFAEAGELLDKNNLVADLHRGLRHLDTVGWERLFQNSEIIEIEGVKMRALRPADHLRVLCVHWLNDGGADRTRLWDIYFAINGNAGRFDWDNFLSPVDKRRRFWLIVVILIAVEYLGLDLERIDPGCKIDRAGLPGWIKNELEREWRSDTRLISLARVLDDREELFKQIFKRLPPNGLQAVVETEGSLENSAGYLPRVRNFIDRTKPSIRRILGFEKD